MMKIDLPAGARQILDTLTRAGFAAYVVGGCVRDVLMGRTPQDWDITTSAKPEQVKALFRATVDTGIEHGTVTVILRRQSFEVTTYRIDGEYKDARHPKSVDFTDDLALDLKRRDFTMNAMAYNSKTGLVDLFDGKKDIKQGVIRCVGDPEQRFEEDALRMLRAVRFAAQLGFVIEKNTCEAILPRAKNLEKISAERIRAELVKLLTGKDVMQFALGCSVAMTAHFLPEFNRMRQIKIFYGARETTVGDHCLLSVQQLNALWGRKKEGEISDPVFLRVQEQTKEFADTLTQKQQQTLAVALLLHDVGKIKPPSGKTPGKNPFAGHSARGAALAETILRRLTFDNQSITAVKRLILHHGCRYGADAVAMRFSVSAIGKNLMPMLFLVQFCDGLAQGAAAQKKLAELFAALTLYREVLSKNPPLTLKDLALNGNDLIALGVKPGPAIGEALKKALAVVLTDPEKNNKKELSAWIKSHVL